MIITAKFNGWCGKCGKPTLKGSEIDYQDKKAFHPACIGEGDIDEADQLALADKLGFTHIPWDALLILHGEDADGHAGNDCDPPGRDAVRDVPSSDTISINDNRGEQGY